MSTPGASPTIWHSGWVASGGGPLLVLPDTLLPYWGGADPPEEALVPRAGNSATDYDRACQVHGHIGVLEIGPGKGLVLADEPAETMWARLLDERGTFLIRWIHADSDEAMIRALDGLREVKCEPTDEVLDVPGGHLVLFDSAMPGSDLLTPHERVAMEKGLYRVCQGRIQPEPSTAAAVYLLAKEG